MLTSPLCTGLRVCSVNVRYKNQCSGGLSVFINFLLRVRLSGSAQPCFEMFSVQRRLVIQASVIVLELRFRS